MLVSFVWPKSPANDAGIRVGDRLVAIDGTAVSTSQQAADLIRAAKGKLTLDLRRAGKPYRASVEPQPMDTILRGLGKKITPEGIIVSADASEAEIDYVRKFDAARIVGRVFPLHIPLDETLYAAGFEVFLLRDPKQAMVGGIEEGPATRAGVRWGDLIVEIDGADPLEKSAEELEGMLSGTKPRSVRVTLDRLGNKIEVELRLEPVSEILRANQRMLVQGQLVPLGVADEDLRCFLRQAPDTP